MKEIFIRITGFVFLSALTTAALAFAYVESKTMSLEDVKAKWGIEVATDYSKFKDSPYPLKAKMAYSIMNDKKLIGKSHKEIRDIFGPNDGYYFSDSVPTYIVQDGNGKDIDTWQLVFKMSREGKLRKVIMHKNCCD